eukprot:1151247-Pelagomonas_calceolata.AAC.3
MKGGLGSMTDHQTIKKTSMCAIETPQLHTKDLADAAENEQLKHKASTGRQEHAILIIDAQSSHPRP